MKQEIKKGYVIGIDGGGTKTTAALANFKGKILKIAKTGSSNLRNVGLKTAIYNISEAILRLINKVRKKEIFSIVIGLAAVEEEFKFKKEKVKQEIFKSVKIPKEKIKIVSDQTIAFKSGTKKNDGLVLIAGTGSVCHGWRRKKEKKVGGWGWLNDEGSGFWVGQRGYQVVFKYLDSRGEKTKIQKLLFQEWKLKNKEELMKKVYGKNSIRNISLISRIVDKAANKGDRIAKSIMEEAGEELTLLAVTVIKKLNFQKEKFPLILVGSMFKSKIILNKVKKEIKKIAPKVEFILPKDKTVVGAIKLAMKK